MDSVKDSKTQKAQDEFPGNEEQKANFIIASE